MEISGEVSRVRLNAMAADVTVVGQVPSLNAISGEVSRVRLNAMAAEATVVGQVPSLNAISGAVGEVRFGLTLVVRLAPRHVM